MNGSQVEVIAAVVGALIAVVSLVLAVREQAKKAANEDAQERQALYNRGVVDGKVSRDAEVRQLTFERDDSNRERDANDRRAQEFENRYNDLRERKGP